MKKENWDACKGCGSYDSSSNILKYGYPCSDGCIPKKEQFECPCITCLVKIICVDPCTQFDIYQYGAKKKENEKL